MQSKKQISILKIFGLFLLCFLTVQPAHAITAAEAFQKGKSALSGAKSISATFTMKVNGQSISGKLLSKGNKFSISSNITSSWYNGTDLYTYMPSKSQTTVFRPNSSELAEANPLMYLNTAGNFNITGTKTKKAGVETVVLIPKSSSAGVKSVTIDLDSKTFLPKYIKVIPSSGSAIELSISNIKLNTNISDSSFNYPKASYPKVKIVDMR